ncbi:hypothetical protein CYY_008931 [Polysphondylium violaceum]|uniref:Tetratricopeptide-like helical domain-containing protein n=1 Tax=Polysphondylium violaceum TaxID=133409 RepID=A0A8J4PMR6_9MYCE|nr:hypothetical protein CYY_008931 [Polysphondylium violaceum]
MGIIDKDIVEAIDYVWNNNFDKADLILSSKAAYIPRYSLHYAETAFLKSFITANESDTEIALKRLKDTRELSENCIKLLESHKIPTNYPSSITTKQDFKNYLLDSKIVLGDSLYMLAVLQVVRDQKFKGIFNLRKSWKIFEDCLKQVKHDESNQIQYSPDLLECLHFGAGFFFFAISIIPQKFLKFVELVGFKADRDQGLAYIRDISNKNGIRAPFGTMVILFNNLLLPRGLYNPASQLKEAELIIEKNLERYPQGSLFQVMASHCYRKQCRIDLGVECMERAIANCSNLAKAPLIYKYELAACYCVKTEWNKAIPIFETLIQEENFQIRALCALQLAAAYIINNDKKKGLDLLGKMKLYAKKSSTVDTVIVRQAQRYLASGGRFAAFEIMYIRRDMAKMEKNMAKIVLDMLNEIAKSVGVYEKLPANAVASNAANQASAFFAKTFSFGKKKEETNAPAQVIVSESLINDRAAYLILKGAILKGIEKFDESMECFQEIIAMQSQITEKFYIPYTYYEMSESYYNKKETSKAMDLIIKCNSISNYDWEDPLKVRLRVTLDQLKRDGNAKGLIEMMEEEEDSHVDMDPSLSDDSLPSSQPTNRSSSPVFEKHNIAKQPNADGATSSDDQEFTEYITKHLSKKSSISSPSIIDDQESKNNNTKPRPFEKSVL